MKPFKRIDARDIARFEAILPGRVLTGDALSEDYEHDEMTEYGYFRPDAVLLALSAQEISDVLRYCNEQHIAVTPRGAGTGLCGGCVALYGGVVLSTERMKRVLEVDTRNMTATVEPGVLLMEFPKYLEGTGLFYPPDPGEKTATMGGNAMTNAGGMRAVRYGVTPEGLTWGAFFLKNLLPVTVGNMIGGVGMGVLFHAAHLGHRVTLDV